ncbi:MAG: hypothetical protein K6G20_05155 [Ruminococcus sp.]|nr:hypothetical protein [Ruminococcus sp.]MCR5729728.1 hypothetical protein [Ruminococcus sp.]
MDIKTLFKGAALGAAAGAVYCAFNTASPSEKHSIKRHAGKTIKSASDLIDDIKSMFM